MFDDTTLIISGIVGLIYFILFVRIYYYVKAIANKKVDYLDYMDDYNKHFLFGEKEKAIESLKNAFWAEYKRYKANPFVSAKKWDEQIAMYERGFKSLGLDIDLKNAVATRGIK